MLGGEIENFRLGAFLTAASELVRCDEIERALWLLDNLPAYYRDNTPIEVTELKNEITARIATPNFYAKGDYDCQFDLNNDKQMDKTLRGMLILKETKELNEKNITPHIIDLGPGEFWLPIILKKFDRKFTYSSIQLNDRSFNLITEHVRDHLKPKDGPTVFVACELIEHLWHEAEIKTEMLRSGGFADVVHISTPRYTFDTRDHDWRNKDLGHLRAYTPKDFMRTIEEMFPEYVCHFYESQILHARLILKTSKYLDVINQNHEL